MPDRFALANMIMVYLLGVIAVAVQFGRGPSILASVLGVLAFDFFFVPPQLTFAVTDTQYLVTFAVMLVDGLGDQHAHGACEVPGGIGPAARAAHRGAVRHEPGIG